MNKTTNINLGGIFFHIDEDAYDKLKKYLDAISRSLGDDPQGKEEIIRDIEQRISELLSERIKNDRQVINEANIDEVIAIMGQPEDYAYDDELFEVQHKEKKTYTHTHRKMYRDGKDKILGGVSSGLGYYFGIDPVWIRILWIVITIFYGTGIIAYIVLWIILPEANTTAEELEMKGKPVNIGNIEKTIKKEYEKIEDKVRNTDYSHLKSGFQDLLEGIGRVLLVLLKALGMFVGVLLIIIAASALIGLIIGLFSWGSLEILGMGNEFVHIPHFFKDSIIPKRLLTLFVFLATIIPFIFLFVLGLNILSKEKKNMGMTANLSLLGIWLVSIIGLTFAGIEHQNQFSHKAGVQRLEHIQLPARDTLFVSMQDNPMLSPRKSLFRSSQLERVEDSLGNEHLYSSYISLDIRPSTTDKVLVKIDKNARAFNRAKAKEKAGEIQYKYTQNDRQLNLSSYFLSPVSL